MAENTSTDTADADTADTETHVVSVEADDADTTSTDGADKDAAKPATSTWKPPTEAEWKAQQEKTKRANAQAAAHRKEADELKRKGESDDEAKMREARESAAAEAEKTWRPRYINQAARAALTEAGVSGPVEPVLRLLDINAVEIDDDGEIVGLDTQVRAIKKGYPALFGKRSIAQVDGTAGTNSKDVARRPGLSATTQKLIDQMRGGN